MGEPKYSELERLAKAATGGEWEFWGQTHEYQIRTKVTRQIVCGGEHDAERGIRSFANAQYIAAANPQAILDLLASLARVRGLLQRAKVRLKYFCGLHFDPCCAKCENFIIELDELLGAESADIGKLDSAEPPTSDSSAPCSPVIQSTQLDTAKEKV